ncbi:RNA-binding S4 domain-containing protein [Fusibacter tunisiensis]|jgi:ribosome-associated protein|uniref:Ribosome-associated protein n=1 Tax=Fusibacter tunisiensis TaxID=1008308 RepID=A0ABS2MNN4_9FIRM|nr:RNA-binding S4 domain-containing protein [Fusibacter tunisiensis]MBM7561007.1 ribosome-associated protein [Fusibacter tunisiensis]
MKKIEISTEFIKLDQLLKFADIIDSGGIAKMIISEGLVSVNGEVCLQRGKKVKPGDLVDVIVPYEDDTEAVFSLKIVSKES